MVNLILAVAVLGLVGCATFKNTPQQDYVYDLGKKCEKQSMGRFAIAWVSSDGKQWRTNAADSGYEIQAFQQCMREQFAAGRK